MPAARPVTRRNEARGREHQEMNELPSVVDMQRYLLMCKRHGSESLALRLIAIGRKNGIGGLPENDDWRAWDAEQVRKAVDFLEQMLIPADPRGSATAPRRP